MSELLSEQYLIALENPHPNNFTMIPNIIDHLTYDDIDSESGEIKIKRLSVYSKELYRILTTIAGDTNICWKNAENLAELCNMSKGQIANCKKELMQKFHQLEGTSLIEILDKKKCTKRDGDKINGTHYHQITVKCIWNYNRAFFLLKKIEKEEARSCGDRAGEHGHVVTAPSEGARSCGDRNNTACSNTPLFKKQHSTAPPNSVCSSNNSEDVSVDPLTSMFNWLMKIGCDEMGAISIVNNFTPDDLHAASGYVQKIMEKKRQKNETLTNIVGYLRKTLQNRWWVNVP